VKKEKNNETVFANIGEDLKAFLVEESELTGKSIKFMIKEMVLELKRRREKINEENNEVSN
jgi:hypothetical protein